MRDVTASIAPIACTSISIPGTSTVAHLEENAGGGTLVLDDETVEALDMQVATPR